MPMPMGMGSGGDSSGASPLTTAGVDFTNSTDAMDFLGELLDDSELQPMDIAMSRAFWYGIVIVIGIATMINIYYITISKSRYARYKVPNSCDRTRE